MKKNKIDFSPPVESISFDFGENKVEVNPHLSIGTQETLIKLYLGIYFDEGRFGNDTDYFGAELALDYALLDVMTSINIELKKFSVDDVYSSRLMEKVKASIVNLPYFRRKLERIVADTKQEQFSPNGLVKQPTASLGELDFEKLKKMAGQIKGLEDFVKDSPIASLMDEGKK